MMSAFIQQAILLAGMPMLIVYACFSDLFRMTISNRLCLAIAAMFIVYALLVGMPTGQFFNHLLAGAAVLAFSFALFAFGWIGGGDAKFVAVLAIWLGFGQLWEYLAISSLLGGALTLAERLGPVKVLFLAGLALDFCVLDSALTARAKGYQEVYIISASGRP